MLCGARRGGCGGPVDLDPPDAGSTTAEHGRKTRRRATAAGAAAAQAAEFVVARTNRGASRTRLVFPPPIQGLPSHCLRMPPPDKYRAACAAHTPPYFHNHHHSSGVGGGTNPVFANHSPASMYSGA